MRQLLFFLFSLLSVFGSEIQLIKKTTPDTNTTLLVIAGIHGNEPGGYFAASLLATHYTIQHNNLWIVPNLNQKSIQANKRGIYGDMNRKFAHVSTKDKDAAIVKEIKDIILSKEVSLVLNLHDGHGFYRKNYQGSIFNPNAWGQTCVIDQCQLNINQKFGNLNQIAKSIRENINKKLLKKHHAFNVKNTNTKFDDEAMRNSLTYFAVTHNKPAFAIETSKNLSTLAQKVFYQLLAIEEFMNIMEIKYTRDFDLNVKTIEKILKEYGYLHINGNIIINLSNIKKTLRYIPLKSSHNRFLFTHPLGSVKKDRHGNFKVYIGNKHVTTLQPQYFKMATQCPKQFRVTTNTKEFRYDLSTEFRVSDDFVIEKMANIRTNIIGFGVGVNDESGVVVRYKQLNKNYSIDKAHKIFRIEFYQDKEFCAMSLVRFK